MSFMLLEIPKAYDKADANFVPPPDLVAKMTKCNNSLTEAGALLSLDAFTPQPRAPASRSAAATAHHQRPVHGVNPGALER